MLNNLKLLSFFLYFISFYLVAGCKEREIKRAQPPQPAITNPNPPVTDTCNEDHEGDLDQETECDPSDPNCKNEEMPTNNNGPQDEEAIGLSLAETSGCPIQPLHEPEYCRDIGKAWEAKDKEITCPDGVRKECYPESCDYLEKNDFTCGRRDDDTAPHRTHQQCAIFIKQICLGQDVADSFKWLVPLAKACWNGEKSAPMPNGPGDWNSIEQGNKDYIARCLGYFEAKKYPKLKSSKEPTDPIDPEQPDKKKKKKKKKKGKKNINSSDATTCEPDTAAQQNTSPTGNTNTQ